MPALMLKFENEPQAKYVLKLGQTLTIGRRDTNNIVVENLAVSGSHAKVECLEQGTLLTDLKSKNGTFVNGKIITSHWLQNNDIITIGKHTMHFTLAEGEDTPLAQDAALDKTMVLDTDQHRFMMSQNVGTGAQKETYGVLSYLKGGEGEVPLRKKLIKIGKDELNDVTLGGFTMGKVAATVSLRPNGYFLSYVGGLSKPKVNGLTVEDTVRLNEFDKIEIGSAQFEFFIKK